MTNYFEVFGLTPSASEQEIRDAYRRLAKRYHPDANFGGGAGQADRMKLINEAKAVLFDSEKRELHRFQLGLEVELQRERIEQFRAEAKQREIMEQEIREHRQWSPASKRSYLILLILFVMGVGSFTLYELLSHSPSSVSPLGQIVLRHQDGTTPFAPVQADTTQILDDSLPSLKHRAQVLLSITDPQAPAYFEKCISLEPGNDTLVLDLARALFRLGRYDQSFGVLYRRVRSDADRINAFSEFGDVFTHQERPLDAKNAYETAMQLGDAMTSVPPSAQAAYLHAVRRLHELR